MQVVYPPPPKEFALFASATSAFDFEVAFWRPSCGDELGGMMLSYAVLFFCLFLF